MKINILGAEYEVLYQTEEENSKLRENDAICELYTKQIILAKKPHDIMDFDNIEEYWKKTLRHEIVHAFIFESGLSVNCNWNEELIADWIALQSSKLNEAFKQAGCV